MIIYFLLFPFSFYLFTQWFHFVPVFSKIFTTVNLNITILIVSIFYKISNY